MTVFSVPAPRDSLVMLTQTPDTSRPFFFSMKCFTGGCVELLTMSLNAFCSYLVLHLIQMDVLVLYF